MNVTKESKATFYIPMQIGFSIYVFVVWSLSKLKLRIDWTWKYEEKLSFLLCQK